MSNYEIVLCHHGILGQKWGKKNGPPYPLNFDDLSEKERDKAKSDSIRNGDIKTAYANRKHYTDQELNDTMNRFNINMKLAQLNQAQVQTGIQKVEKLCDTMGKISDYGEKAVKGWNTVAKISNSLAGTDLPIISNDGKKDKSDKQQNNNQNQNQKNQKKDKGGNNSYNKAESKAKAKQAQELAKTAAIKTKEEKLTYKIYKQTGEKPNNGKNNKKKK